MFVDSAISQNLAENQAKIAESELDSAIKTQNEKLNEFIISYYAIMKNNALIGEKFSVSKALSTTPNPRIIAQCDIESNALDSNLAILKQNQSAILECFEQTLHSKIRDDIKSINNEVRTKTTYKIPAQRILLDRQRSKIHIIGQK